MHSRNEAARRSPPRQRDHGTVPRRLRLADLHRVAADDRLHASRRHHRDLVGPHRLPAGGHQPVGGVRAARRRPWTIRDLRGRIRRHGGELSPLRHRAKRACAHPVPGRAGNRRGHDRLRRARAGDRGDAGGLRGSDERIHDDGISLGPPARAARRRGAHRSRGLAMGLLPLDPDRIDRDRADHPGSPGAAHGAAARPDLHRLRRRGASDRAHHHVDRAAR